MAVYTFIILVLPYLLSQPMAALAVASAFALSLNYVGACGFVFTAPRALKRLGAPLSHPLISK